MLTQALEKRFKIAEKINTDYALSLPIIGPSEECLFTFEWSEQDGKKVIVIHELYVLSLKNGEVSVHSLNEKGLPSDRITEGIRGVEAIEIEEKYMELYENIRADYYKESSEQKETLKEYFFKLITDNALLDVYKKFGKEMFW